MAMGGGTPVRTRGVHSVCIENGRCAESIVVVKLIIHGHNSAFCKFFSQAIQRSDRFIAATSHHRCVAWQT